MEYVTHLEILAAMYSIQTIVQGIPMRITGQRNWNIPLALSLEIPQKEILLFKYRNMPSTATHAGTMNNSL